MAVGARWSRAELLVALDLYFELPFGLFSQTQPRIIEVAAAIGRTPSALAMKLSNFASIDDTIPQGGLKNVSQADRDLWSELQGDPKRVEAEISDATSALGSEAGIVPHFSATAPSADFTAAETSAPRKIRRGQAIFRLAVLATYNSKCCLTGISDPRLLIASHIRPWSVDEQNRLNPANGLCLNALHDKAFDQGLMTIDENFKLKLSPQLSSVGNKFFMDSFKDLEGKSIRIPEQFPPSQEFLAHHREVIFKR